MLIPTSRDNSNLRQRIWGLMVAPWVNITKFGHTYKFFGNDMADCLMKNPNWTTGQMSYQNFQNVIDYATPGSVTTQDQLIWILTMLDSSYYNLLQRAKQYVIDNDLSIERIMVIEIVPADFNLSPTM